VPLSRRIAAIDSVGSVGLVGLAGCHQGTCTRYRHHTLHTASNLGKAASATCEDCNTFLVSCRMVSIDPAGLVGQAESVGPVVMVETVETLATVESVAMVEMAVTHHTPMQAQLLAFRSCGQSGHLCC